MSLFQKLFAAPPVPAIGLDIGSSSIKLLQVAKSSDGYKITKLLSHPTPPLAVKEDGRILEPALMAEEVKNMIRKTGVTVKRAVAAVSGIHVVIRTITMPSMTEKEVQNSIKYEAERYIPYSVAEAQIAGTILRNPLPGDEKNMEVLLMASPKEIVRSVEEVITMAGLEVEAIELEAIALLRWARLVLPPDLLKQTVAVINVGASSTSINIFNNEILRNSRTISVAGNSLTRAIAQAMNVSFEEAEKLKIEKGLVRIEKDTAPVPPTTMRIFKIILPVLTEFTTEIQRSFDFYRSRYRGESVDVVYLTGGTSRFKNLDRYIAGELGVRVESINSIRMEHKGGISGLSPEKAQELSPLISVGLGLSARYMN